MSYNPKRKVRWYFGGVASSMATCVTHPLDLMKVLIQTQSGKLSMGKMTKNIVKESGVMGLYNGISAALLRQYTYTLARFGLYSVGNRYLDTTSMTNKVLLSGLSGGIGGLVGAPADLLNVRMQNDMKLPPEKRRNYNHCFDGLIRVCREEGWTNLFNGASTAAVRGMCMTVGQIAFYEQTKDYLLDFGMQQQMSTYILASLVSAIAATTLTQPIDVIKTRSMSAKPGEYEGISDCIFKTAKEGPMAFFKGYTPAFARLGPHTVMLFLALEFLRTYFGYLPEDKK